MTTKIDIFKPPKSDEEAGIILADHMAQGRAWGDKKTPGSVMNGIINGLASNFKLVQEKIFELAQEFDINETQNLIEEWQISVGIPDACVFEFDTLSEQQQRVIQRLRKTPVVTLAELQEYIQAFFDSHIINISPGTTANKFTLIVTAEEGADFALLECLLRNIIPANVLISLVAGFFGFAEDPDALGFGTLSDNTVGGNFVSL